jgi:hypothetical protein
MRVSELTKNNEGKNKKGGGILARKKQKLAAAT